jgi:hypothetical protein
LDSFIGLIDADCIVVCAAAYQMDEQGVPFVLVHLMMIVDTNWCSPHSSSVLESMPVLPQQGTLV